MSKCVRDNYGESVRKKNNGLNLSFLCKKKRLFLGKQSRALPESGTQSNCVGSIGVGTSGQKTLSTCMIKSVEPKMIATFSETQPDDNNWV